MDAEEKERLRGANGVMAGITTWVLAWKDRRHSNRESGGGGDGVRSGQGIEQRSRSFNVTNFGIGFYDDVFERGEVPFGMTDVEVPEEVGVPEI